MAVESITVNLTVRKTLLGKLYLPFILMLHRTRLFKEETIIDIANATINRLTLFKIKVGDSGKWQKLELNGRFE